MMVKISPKEESESFPVTILAVIHKVRRTDKYTAEKDAIIRYLRDDLENNWDDVALLYNEYWNGGMEGPDANCLRIKYNTLCRRNRGRSRGLGRLRMASQKRELKTLV
jgi:hypothetical protein